MRSALLLALLSACPAVAAEPTPFAKFVDDYYSALFDWDPMQATAAGIHDRDDRLGHRSVAAVHSRVVILQRLAARLAGLRTGKLSEADATDAQVLDLAIRAELLDLETVRDWKRNPMVYLIQPAGGIDLVMKRTFASPEARLRSIIGRLKATPPLLTAMRQNVENAPKEFTDLGLIIAKGSVGYFKNDLTTWAKTAAGKDEKLLAEFETANKAVIEGFETAVKWLEEDLLPSRRAPTRSAPTRS